MKEETCLEVLGRFIAQIRCENLSDTVIKKAERCLLETLQNAFSHWEDERRQAAFQYVRKQSGALPPAHLLGTKCLADAENSAFFAAAAAACAPRLDTHRKALCHPGSVAVPVALCVGEAGNMPGCAVVEGIVAGYEAMIRLGLSLQAGNIPPAVRRTSLSAAFCGAVTAAKVMGLSHEKIAAAAGLACHFSFGTNQWAVSGSGEDAFQSAWGAKCGIMAARLAECGAAASPDGLEGKRGLFAAYGIVGESGKDIFLDELEKEYRIQEVEHKPVDACLFLQSPCQAAEAVVRRYHPCPEGIESILIKTSGQARKQCGTEAASSISGAGQAANHIAFGVASVLSVGDSRRVRWEPPYDPLVLSLASRCCIEEDSSYTACFPEKLPVYIEIWLRDGSHLVWEQEDYETLGEEEGIRMAEDSMADRLGKEIAELQMERIQKLPELMSIKRLMEDFAQRLEFLPN